MLKNLKLITKNPYFWATLILMLASFFLRFWRLDEPNEIVFDETYYAKYANNYLVGESFFDVHPPIGKLLIAIGIKFFGFNAFGWRFTEAILGGLIIFVSYFLFKRVFKNRAVGFLTALFIAFDGLFLVNSRIALLDSFLVFFVLSAYLFFFLYKDEIRPRRQAIYLLLTGIAGGLAVATKWTGIAPLAVIWIWHFGEIIVRAIRQRRRAENSETKLLHRNVASAPFESKNNFFYFLFGFFALIILPAAIYLGSFIFNRTDQTFWQYIAWWHQQTWGFHRKLKDAHPYMSRWWSWLYLARPVWFYYKESGDIVRGVIALGNPLLWWSGMGFLFWSIVKVIKKKELLFPLFAFAAAYIPWIFIGRTQFNYYIIGAMPFYFSLIAYWLVQIYKKDRFSVYFYIALIFATFMFFYPLLTAYPISKEYYQWHIWFRNWI